MPRVSVAECYCKLCKEFNERVIVEILTLLERNPSFLDLSLTYFSKKHFKCILALIKTRPEIESVSLNNCSLNSDDLSLLFEAIREKKIVLLSLKNVLMSAVDGEQLKELCKINPHIVSINLDGTLLPDQLSEMIEIAVKLNKAREDEWIIRRTLKIENAKKNIYSKTYFWPCSVLKKNPLLMVKMKTQSASQIMKEIVKREDERFVDHSFNYETMWFEELFPNLKWYRGFSIAKTSETVCIGNTPVIMPDYWKNENLCNALNLVQAGSNLVSSVLCRDLRDVSCFGFQFFLEGTTVEVFVDDYLPVLEKNGELFMVGLHSNSSDFWGSLIEKAIAKLFGGYSELGKLSLTDYMLLLTGGLCFFKNPRDLFSFEMHEIFHSVRQMLLKYKRFFCMAIPKDSLASQALIEKGIRPNYPYTVVSTDICKLNGITEYLVQVIGHPLMSFFSESYSFGNYKNTKYLGFPHFWMRFEQFFVYFNRAFLVIWRYLVHQGNLWSNFQKKEASVKWGVNSPLFAENPAFMVKCTNDSPVFLFLSIECSEEDAHICKQLHLFPLNDDVRRYDISSKNEIDCSEKITGTVGGILVEMMPEERLQIVPSAEASCCCVIKAVTLSSFTLTSLLPSRHCYYLEGTWDFFRCGTRVSSLFHMFKNVSLVDQKTFLFSLSQELGDHGPFGVSLLIWVTSVPDNLDVFQNPEIETEIICEEVSSFKVEIRVPQESFIVVVPCRHDRECLSTFQLAVYSEDKLSLESRTCNSVSCSTNRAKYLL